MVLHLEVSAGTCTNNIYLMVLHLVRISNALTYISNAITKSAIKLISGRVYGGVFCVCAFIVFSQVQQGASCVCMCVVVCVSYVTMMKRAIN